MAFEELRDRLKNDLQLTLNRLQDSSLFNQLKDRYDNLSPSGQKLTLSLGAVIVAATLLSFPYDYYSQSAANEEEFLNKRNTLRSLLQVTRESKDVPQIPAAPDLDSLKSQVEFRLNSAYLTEAQRKSIESVDAQSQIISSDLTQGAVKVELEKLNIKQVTDLGHSLQNINPSVKLVDLILKANREDSRYFDVTYKLVTLSVPDSSADSGVTE